MTIYCDYICNCRIKFQPERWQRMNENHMREFCAVSFCINCILTLQHSCPVCNTVLMLGLWDPEPIYSSYLIKLKTIRDTIVIFWMLFDTHVLIRITLMWALIGIWVDVKFDIKNVIVWWKFIKTYKMYNY